MADDYEIAKVLDLQGLLCPIPVVKVSKAVKDINIGEVIEATATDPGVMMDIPAWCKSSGNEMVKMAKEDGIFRFVVRRLK
ncbi:MAG: sulfurtransferase TusA family protein [Gammaproteobacteria bacterium]|nr:sulfurtransferase TusA family protein [Gammaproteobacteria bacterium]MDJ0870561.1 sulfurtransferase TusA family protein [Gammaproteobacteria bacterium]MDJ0891399.1 sulfurtransferase TusA family protein [Gammaproteobacteria bacterium]